MWRRQQGIVVFKFLFLLDCLPVKHWAKKSEGHTTDYLYLPSFYKRDNLNVSYAKFLLGKNCICLDAKLLYFDVLIIAFIFYYCLLIHTKFIMLSK